MWPGLTPPALHPLPHTNYQSIFPVEIMLAFLPPGPSTARIYTNRNWLVTVQSHNPRRPTFYIVTVLYVDNIWNMTRVFMSPTQRHVSQSLLQLISTYPWSVWEKFLQSEGGKNSRLSNFVDEIISCERRNPAVITVKCNVLCTFEPWQLS